MIICTYNRTRKIRNFHPSGGAIFAFQAKSTTSQNKNIQGGKKMSFCKMIELLQNKDKGKIILINSGAFYIARGKDELLLHNILDLKVNCMETEICKVGFPKNSLEKYTKLIQEKGYSYIVYNFDSNTSKLTILKKYNGNKLNNTEENKLNCYICSNTVKMYKKNDKYIQAVAELYEEEMEENKIKEKNNSKRKIILIRKLKKKINYN